MAYAFLQTVNAFNSASGTGLGVSITHAANSTAFIWVNYELDTATASLADTLGNSYSQVGSYLTESGARRAALFIGAINTGGATTVTLTISSAATTRCIDVTTYSGLSQTAQSGANSSGNQTNPGTAANGITTGNMTPTAQPAILFAVCRDFGGAGTATAGTGFTSRGTLSNQDTGDGEASRIEDKRLTATTAVAGTFTASVAADHCYTFGVVVSESATGNAFSGSGTETSTGTGAAKASDPFSTAATLTQTGTGVSVASAAGSIAGASTSNAVGASKGSADITSNAVAVVSGVGASTDSGAFTSASVASPAGVGAATDSGAFISTSVAVAAGDSGSGGTTVSASGSIAASSTSTATGAATGTADAQAAAANTTTGAGASIDSGAFATNSVATASGDSGVAATVVSASGSITAGVVVKGVSPSTVTRKAEGARPHARRPLNDDEELMELAALIVPMISHGGAAWRV